MSDVRQLYQDAILEHSKNPRNATLPAAATCRADGHNPLCGDKVTIAVELDGDIVRDIGFRGLGCAISLAAASMMTEAVKGLARADIDELWRDYQALIAGQADAPVSERPVSERMAPLAAFTPVASYPARRQCATLCWDTLREALEAGFSE